jgi:hypothetical protein
VLNRIARDWEELTSARPGYRFQSFYDRRQSRRMGSWSPSRVAVLLSGLLMVLVGPLVGVIPGPGGIAVFGLGLALLATEFRPVARLLDRLEMKARRGWTRTARNWRTLPAISKVALSALALALVVASGYLGLSLVY